MSNNHSPSSSINSTNTGITTPEETPVDNIWASDGEDGSNGDQILSDLPSMKRQHMTDGYREGLEIGKAQVMQKGFDQGYPIGVSIACRAGKILGCFEGILAMKGLSDSQRSKLTKEYDTASQQLSITTLFQNMDDQTLTQSSDIPECVEKVIHDWEVKVFQSDSGRQS